MRAPDLGAKIPQFRRKKVTGAWAPDFGVKTSQFRREEETGILAPNRSKKTSNPRARASDPGVRAADLDTLYQKLQIPQKEDEVTKKWTVGKGERVEVGNRATHNLLQARTTTEKAEVREYQEENRTSARTKTQSQDRQEESTEIETEGGREHLSSNAVTGSSIGVAPKGSSELGGIHQSKPKPRSSEPKNLAPKSPEP